MSCPHCADRLDHGLARRIRVLQLLALVEHPDALPAGAALRIAGELLDWLALEERGPSPVPASTPRIPAQAQA